MRHHYASIRTAKLKNSENLNAGNNVEKLVLSYIAGGNVEWHSHSRK